MTEQQSNNQTVSTHPVHPLVMPWVLAVVSFSVLRSPAQACSCTFPLGASPLCSTWNSRIPILADAIRNYAVGFCTQDNAVEDSDPKISRNESPFDQQTVDRELRRRAPRWQREIVPAMAGVLFAFVVRLGLPRRVREWSCRQWLLASLLLLSLIPTTSLTICLLDVRASRKLDGHNDPANQSAAQCIK